MPSLERIIYYLFVTIIVIVLLVVLVHVAERV